MADMKFKYTIQDYQTDAVNSVVKIFAEQSFQNRFSYRRDTGTIKLKQDIFNYMLSDEELYMGFSNAPVSLEQSQLLRNIQHTQAENNIKQSDSLAKHMGSCSFAGVVQLAFTFLVYF